MDIVERLKNRPTSQLRLEAAAEIERLRAENGKLRSAMLVNGLIDGHPREEIERVIAECSTDEQASGPAPHWDDGRSSLEIMRGDPPRNDGQKAD